MKILKYILFFSLLSFIFYLLYLLSPTSFSDEKIRFVIPLNTPQEDILKKLKRDNFTRSAEFVSIILAIIAPIKKIEPGSYMLTHRITIFDLVNTLLNDPYQRWIVLIPGLRVEQISEKLGEKFHWDEAGIKKFLSVAKEGYMFPDTYLLHVKSTPEEMAYRLISNFNEKFDKKLQKDLLDQDVRNDTAIKIASPLRCKVTIPFQGYCNRFCNKTLQYPRLFHPALYCWLV